MLRVGIGLLATGLVAIAAGMGATGWIDLLPTGGWHLTLFPTGVGVFILIVGGGVLAVAGLRCQTPAREGRVDEPACWPQTSRAPC